MNHSGDPHKKYKFDLSTLEQHLNDYMTYGYSTIPPLDEVPESGHLNWSDKLILTEYDLEFLKGVGVKI